MSKKLYLPAIAIMTLSMCSLSSYQDSKQQQPTPQQQPSQTAPNVQPLPNVPTKKEVPRSSSQKELTASDVGRLHAKAMKALSEGKSRNLQKELQRTVDYLVKNEGFDREQTQSIANNFLESCKKQGLIDKAGNLDMNTRTVNTLINTQEKTGYISSTLASQLKDIANSVYSTPKPDWNDFVNRINGLTASSKTTSTTNDAPAIAILQGIATPYSHGGRSNPPGWCWQNDFWGGLLGLALAGPGGGLVGAVACSLAGPSG